MQTDPETSSGANGHRPPLNVAVIGLGRAALGEHIPAFRRMPGLFRVAAVCDLLRERRDLVAGDFPKAAQHRRVEDALADPGVELAVVALPSLDHADVALAALERGLWTVVETPLALTHDAATVLKAAAVKARGKLFVYTRGMFAPDFRMAASVLDDPCLGEVFEVRVRRQDYVRRDDWQAVKRCGGGAAWYEGVDAVMQAVALMRAQPVQMWSELKRVAALGDAEDFMHMVLKSRGDVTADIEICGGQLPPFEPAFTVRGSRGSFTVAPGAARGVFRVVDPAFKFPRRRSSVRTPGLEDLHEDLPVVEIPAALPDADDPRGAAEKTADAFWRTVYATARTAAPFPVALDSVTEATRYLQLAKKASPFAVK